MSEFIISSEQLERLIEGIEHDTGRKINKVVCDGAELPEIVRCRDCIRYSLDDYGNTWCAYVASAVQPDDFCSWGEREDGEAR